MVGTKSRMAAKLLLFVVGTLLVGPGHASAHNTDPSPDDAVCSVGDFCLYNAFSFSSYNGLATWDGSDQAYSGVYPNNSSFALDNTGSSAKNRGTTCKLYLYYQPNWGRNPVVTVFAIGATNSNLSSELYATNNNASSHHWCNDNHL